MDITWNYSEHNLEKMEYATQTDWNQTLVTAINVVAKFNEVFVFVPKKFEPLFNTLFFFDKNNNTLKTNYKIKFIDSKEDTLILPEGKVIISNFT